MSTTVTAFIRGLVEAWRRPEGALLPRRELIVNADDFGLDALVNAGIERAYEAGIVTCTSLMVRREAAPAAAAYASANPSLGVGLHVDLGEWEYHGGTWQPRYEVVDLDDIAQVRAEIDRQLAKFRALLARDPTHLDSHQHVHRREPVRTVLLDLARRLRVPLRHVSSTVRYCGEFYGQLPDATPNDLGISVPALVALLTRLPAGVTELCCHPATGQPSGDQYGPARPKELQTLCDPRIRTALAANHVMLRTFKNLPNGLDLIQIQGEGR